MIDGKEPTPYATSPLSQGFHATAAIMIPYRCFFIAIVGVRVNGRLAQRWSRMKKQARIRPCYPGRYTIELGE